MIDLESFSNPDTHDYTCPMCEETCSERGVPFTVDTFYYHIAVLHGPTDIMLAVLGRLCDIENKLERKETPASRPGSCYSDDGQWIKVSECRDP